MALRALMQKYGPAAAISYSSVTLTFFSTIYATLTFGYDPTPFILEVVSHAAMAESSTGPCIKAMRSGDDADSRASAGRRAWWGRGPRPRLPR